MRLCTCNRYSEELCAKRHCAVTNFLRTSKGELLKFCNYIRYINKVNELKAWILKFQIKQWRIQGRAPGGPGAHLIFSEIAYFLWSAKIIFAEFNINSQALKSRPPPLLKVWIRHCKGLLELTTFIVCPKISQHFADCLENLADLPTS